MATELEVIEPTKRNWISYSGLLVMSALNAFNDNFARFTLVPLGAWLVKEGQGFEGVQHLLALFMVLPYVLFAPTSGWLADRFPKSRILHWAAWMQVVVIALMVFALSIHSLLLAVTAFFLLALQSTLMSPAKAGILKELLGSKRLALGSGMMDGILILAILGGQIYSGRIFDGRLDQLGDGWLAGKGPLLALGVTCLAALAAVAVIERTRAISATPFSLSVAFRHVRDFGSLWERRALRLSALGVAFFWGFGGLMNLIIIEIAETLHGGGKGTGTSISLMMGWASVGIALGSVATGIICRRGAELGLVPLGGVLMTISSALLAATTSESLPFLTGLFVTGAGAAVFYVPLRAFLVDQCPDDERGKLLSVSNLLTNLVAILAVGLQLLMKSLGIPTAWQFGLMAILAVWATWHVLKLLPSQFLRFVALSLIRSLYRIRVKGAEDFPQEGGVLLCPNHMTFVDALVVSAACPRPVRFLMAEQCFHRKWVGDFARLFNAVPVSPTKAKEAIRIAADEVAAGNVVCIFPEGQLSRSGAVNEVKKGYEMIARKAGSPVVPLHMHGLWGTFTSFAGGHYFRKRPRKIGAGIRVALGGPIPPKEATASTLKSFWRAQSAAALEETELDQRNFADPSRFLREEPSDWWEAVHVLGAMPSGDFQTLARDARALANVAFWNRGDRVLLAWDGTEKVGLIFGVLLPPVAGVKIVLAPVAGGPSQLRKLAMEERCNRLVVPQGFLSVRELESLRGLRPFVYGPWTGDEDELKMEGIYPGLTKNGHLLTWSMPHPEDINPMAKFQPGWKSGSAGRLLPHVSPGEVAGWQADEEDFLFREGTGSAGL